MDAHEPSTPESIHHHPIGQGESASTQERLGLYVWLVAMTGFLVWLIGFGVNV